MRIYLENQSKNVSYINNKGFTMLEMLYAFSIFLLFAAFFPLSMRYLLQHDDLEARSKVLEWNVFMNQLKKELRMAESFQVLSGERITLNKSGQVILYEKNGTNIRRRVDAKGHEIVFQAVDTVHFENINNGVKLTVRDVYDQQLTASLYSYVQLEEANAP